MPISDTLAASLVRPTAENRPNNTTANQYRPSSTEIDTFRHGESNRYGETAVQANPYDAYVTGGFAGTTDEIIQWAAAKWGIPADWLRAQYVKESWWDQTTLGDLTTVADVTKYPAHSRANSTQVYQSLGISQVRWNHPDLNDDNIGVEPLRWKSTSFNADFQAAGVRFYFDNPQGKRSTWGDSTYSACNAWLSIGGWFQPYPWNNSQQNAYVNAVQTNLQNRTWEQPGF